MSVETHAKETLASFSYSLSFTTRSSHVVPQFLYPRTEMTRRSPSPLINTLNPAPSIVYHPSLLLCHPKSFHTHIQLKRIYIGKVLHSDHAGRRYNTLSHLTSFYRAHWRYPWAWMSPHIQTCQVSIDIHTHYVHLHNNVIHTHYVHLHNNVPATLQ
jgi:hypothetical protein